MRGFTVMIAGMVLGIALQSSTTFAEMTASRPSKNYVVGFQFLFDKAYTKSVDSMINGTEFAREEFERLHPGVKIQLKRYTYSSDLTSTVRATQKAIKDGMVAVLGGQNSDESIIMGELFNANKIVLVAPTASHPKVTENRPFVFRGCYSDAQVAKRLAEFVVQKLKASDIGVVQNVSSPYSDYLSSEFAKLAEVSAKESRSPLRVTVAKTIRGTFDFGPIIDDFQRRKITHVTVLDHGGDILRFNAQASERGFTPTYIGSDGWGSTETVHQRFVRDSIYGNHFQAYMNTFWHDESRAPSVLSFRRAYKKRFGSEPDAFAAISWDTAQVLFEALVAAGPNPNGEAIRRALRAIRPSGLVTTNQFSFDENNSPKKSLVIYKIDQAGIRHEVTLQ
jgi:branched-chain amino acid transport system substrate-binding protein